MVRDLLGISLVRLVLYLSVFVILATLLFSIAEDFSTGKHFNQASIEAFIASTGVYSYLVYVFLVAFLAITPIASSTLWLIAGYLFNPLIAIFLTIIAEALGGVGNFYIGKWLIGGLLKRGRWPRLAAGVQRYVGKINFLTIFMLGLLPVSTTNVTAYAASLSGMPLWRYLIPWVSGMTVLSTLTILLGHSAATGSPWLALGMIAAVITLFLGLKWISRRYLVFMDERRDIA